MIQSDFWQDVPPLNVGAYIEAMTLDFKRGSGDEYTASTASAGRLEAQLQG